MRSVRISAKSARALLDFFHEDNAPPPYLVPLISGLHAALRPSPNLRASKRARAGTKKEKSALKRVATSDIRSEVIRRAGGECEACGEGFGNWNLDQLDHFWGRGKVPQSAENCWLIHQSCHRQKTDNHPSRALWLERFRAHAIRNGFMREAAKAGREIDSIADIAEAAALTGGGR